MIHVALNRGYAFGKKSKPDDTGINPPVFYVFPAGLVQGAQNKNDSWGKVRIDNILNLENYIENWKLIEDFLNQ